MLEFIQQQTHKNILCMLNKSMYVTYVYTCMYTLLHNTCMPHVLNLCILFIILKLYFIRTLSLCLLVTILSFVAGL